jgi:hypothetical protein
MRCWILSIALLALFVFAYPWDISAGDKTRITNLDKLNTSADEEDPCPTPDGLGLLYATRRDKSYDIFASRRTTALAAFPAGRAFIFDKVADERCPFVFKDRYYFSTNDVPDPKFAKLKNYDILFQVGFQRPLPVLGEINSKADEMYPMITPSGKELYFSRKTEDGWKLFVAKGPVPGPIGNAKEVGFPANFHKAAIGGKGELVMYLQGPLDEDGKKVGIFRSKRDKVGGEWYKPEPVKALNHAESKRGDMQPAITADGTRLYFVSDRPGGKGGLDIWTVATAQLK